MLRYKITFRLGVFVTIKIVDTLLIMSPTLDQHFVAEGKAFYCAQRKEIFLRLRLLLCQKCSFPFRHGSRHDKLFNLAVLDQESSLTFTSHGGVRRREAAGFAAPCPRFEPMRYNPLRVSATLWSEEVARE